MKIAGSVVLVTGANRGLGAEYVRQLLDRGAAKVYAAARKPETITTPGVVPIKLDVTNANDIAAAVEQCGDITMLINNAGVVIGGRIRADHAL
jgi:NAD(P)-dependent dehydrogenase (short-subunit alcohol dehydrogenase family)